MTREQEILLNIVILAGLLALSVYIWKTEHDAMIADARKIAEAVKKTSPEFQDAGR